MHTRALSPLYIFIILLTTALFSCASSAHSDDINQATLSLDNSEHYQLVVTVDLLHLLKKNLNISGDDTKVIGVLNQLSFVEQKKLLEHLQVILSQQTSLHFTYINEHRNIDGNIEQNLKHNISPFKGLQLQHLKRILSQQAGLTEYKAQLNVTGDIPQGVGEVAVRFSPLLGDIVLKVIRPQQEIIRSASLSNRYKISLANANLAASNAIVPTRIKLAADYIYQGFVHILPLGLDHILFVLALLLFAKRRSTLLWQVSAFTLAHTITLALSIYGVVALSSAIVEPLIALSIVYVGVENIYRAQTNTTSYTRMPIIFAFGLLHGLGFASVLGDLGLAQSQYALSLISFNIGVELGQLTVIALAFIFLYPLRSKVWYQKRLVLSLNIAIAVIAIYWLIERLI
ncbi:MULTISPECIES: HupE/UreJ family protein [unclassified Colwellia]|uniref:HupE/UreJ family protein n=1 Tax=unclassified Colwellia TaxID=196834 RepID=UPI001C70D815|nr:MULTISPECIES: HupE/UreJ family protein [unclassified Colwellia]